MRQYHDKQISSAQGCSGSEPYWLRSNWIVFFLFAASLVLLSAIAFHSKAPLVFFRFDGVYVLILATMQHAWANSNWFFTSNPLQGIGGLELPQHNLIDPALWIAVRLPPQIGPTVAMTIYAVFLATAISWLGWRLRLSIAATIGAVWLGVLLALPYVYPSFGFDFLWGVPDYILLIVFSMFSLLLFLDVGRGSPRADAARCVGIAASFGYICIQFPDFIPVTLCALGFFGVFLVIVAESRRERLTKIGASLVLSVIAIAIFGKLTFGLYGFAKPTFFWYEFYPRPISFRDVSFFIAGHSRWPAWIVYGTALAGAMHAATRGKGDLRDLARGFLLFVMFIYFVVMVAGTTWKGPRMAYIDIFAFPIYCVFAAYAATRVMSWLALKSGRVEGLPHVGLAFLIAPWFVLFDYRPPLERPLVKNGNPFIWPPVRTSIVEFLENELQLSPGAIFRGRVASVAGSKFEPQWARAPFITQHNYDAMNLFFSGNDHRMYGFWYYNIPTLFEANQFSSPFFHLVNARLLNAPQAQDLRSYETQSVVNDRIMALLGVRYLVNDQLLLDRAPSAHLKLVEGREIYVYPVAHANVAGYSVTQVTQVSDAQEAINFLGDPRSAVWRSAVTTERLDLPPLVAATQSKVFVERGGYRVEAESPGSSLLVLPIEFSNCLRGQFSSDGGLPPRLLRMNLAMAGLLFSGRVTAHLKLRYGPFDAECRLEDWREAKAAGLVNARTWPVTDPVSFGK